MEGVRGERTEGRSEGEKEGEKEEKRMNDDRWRGKKKPRQKVGNE